MDKYKNISMSGGGENSQSQLLMIESYCNFNLKIIIAIYQISTCFKICSMSFSLVTSSVK